MNKHLLTLMFILAAIALYVAGMVLPATGLLVLGAISEGIFWVRLFRRTRTGNSKSDQQAE